MKKTNDELSVEYIRKIMLHRITNALPIAFTKFGDGEFNCTSTDRKKLWRNCDGDVYTDILSTSLIEAFVHLANEPNAFLGRWPHTDHVAHWDGFREEHPEQKSKNPTPCGIKKPTPWVNYHALATYPQYMDADLLKIYTSIRDYSAGPKFFVGNALMARATALLNIPTKNHIKIGLNCWFNLEIKNSIISHICQNSAKNVMVVFCAGMGSKPLISTLSKLKPDGLYIDVGSFLDYLCLKQDTRGWNIYVYPLTYEETCVYFRRLLPDDWEDKEKWGFILKQADVVFGRSQAFKSQAAPEEKGHVYVELIGGLGNQLFTIMAAYAYSIETGRTLFCIKCDNSPSVLAHRPVYFHNIMRNIKLMPANVRTHNAKRYNFMAPSYTKIPRFEQNQDIILHGHFQSKRYFMDHFSSIVEHVIAHEYIVEAEKCLTQKYDSTSLAFIHFRRGDFLILAGGVMTLPLSPYYEQALQKFPDHVNFLIFCEDKDQEKLSMELKNNREFQKRKWSMVTRQIPDYIQLLMMSQCPCGGIIANSTFSTWAAFLSLDTRQNKKKSASKTFVAPRVIVPGVPHNALDFGGENWIFLDSAIENNHEEEKCSTSSLLSSENKICWL